MNAQAAKGSGGIQSLETGLAIAFAIARAGRRLSLTEIGQELDILPSTVHRHLVSLSRLGLVQQAEPNGRYEIGPSAAEFGFAALRSMDTQGLWTEAISRLRDDTGLTTLAVVWGSFGPTVVQWKASISPVTLHVHLGAALPVVTSASGHIFCAFMEEHRTRALIDKEFRAGRPPTLRGKPLTRQMFKDVLQQVRKDHLSVIQGDLHSGIDSLSAPVFDFDGEVRLSLAILAAEREIDVTPAGPHATALKATADWLSARLGYSPKVS